MHLNVHMQEHRQEESMAFDALPWDEHEFGIWHIQDRVVVICQKSDL